MKNLKNATFMILSACMLFLSSCAQSTCHKTDSNGNWMYDNNGNPIMYDCSGGSSTNNNAQATTGTGYAFLPYNDIVGKYDAEDCRLYSDFGQSSQSNTSYFGANSEGDGIIDFFVSGGVKILCREVPVDFTGDGYITEADGIVINNSIALGPVLTSAQIHSLVNGQAPAGFTLTTRNGVRGFLFTTIRKSLPVAYSGLDVSTGRGTGQRYYLRASY